MSGLRRVLAGIDAVNMAGAAFAAVCAMVLATILFVEAIATAFFSYSQPWAVEYSLYLQAIILFGGAGWALRNGGHIRVPMLLDALAPRARHIVDVLCTAFGLGVIGFCAYALVGQAMRTVQLGSVSFYPLSTPLWIPQSMLAAAFVLFALAFLARLVRLLIGDEPEVENTVGGTIE